MQSSQVLPGERGLLHGIRARHVWTQHCGTDSLDRAHLEIAFLTCHRLCQNTAPSCLAKFNQKIYIFGKYNVLIIGCFQRANLILWVALFNAFIYVSSCCSGNFNSNVVFVVA